jgi:hypothetical protein
MKYYVFVMFVVQLVAALSYLYEIYKGDNSRVKYFEFIFVIGFALWAAITLWA